MSLTDFSCDTTIKELETRLLPIAVSLSSWIEERIPADLETGGTSSSPPEVPVAMSACPARSMQRPSRRRCSERPTSRASRAAPSRRAARGHGARGTLRCSSSLHRRSPARQAAAGAPDSAVALRC